MREIISWVKDHWFSILLWFLVFLIINFILWWSIGFDCLFHGIDCPPVSNMTG